MNTSVLPDITWFETQSRRTLDRLLPRLEERYRTKRGRMSTDQWRTFTHRLDTHFPQLFKLLYHVYGQQYDFFYYLEELLNVAARMWLERSAELKALDSTREHDPQWFQSNRMLGGVCYVDLFAGDLNGLQSKTPYFKELGLTYLHLMPLFRCPEGNNDGGYAVSSYREVDPQLGTIDQLRALASELRQNGISLVLDFVFNHTSDEHAWAIKARSGDRDFQDYYRMFPDRTMPDAYEKTLREIFPDEHPGAFTYLPDIERWVWTTFHTFQWDLNYANPAVFNAMAEEMLALANVGVEVLRLDAVAFIWKQLGTSCENLPEAHILIQAFNAVTRIAAPAMLFKSEAIVHPADVVKYIRWDECQLSYNPLLMALLWNSLATRKTRLLTQAMRSRFKIPDGCAWVNYVRCHDDIGWTFSDEDAAVLGVNGYDHRQFLNAFYTGRFEGSFARGLPFQENPKTGDCRISGTSASLAGLEKALTEETEVEVELAIRRIVLIHGVILTIGGIPLIYLGDEIGMLNDYDYRNDPAKADDSRWVHRPFTNWEKAAQRTDTARVEGKIYQRLRQLINLRQRCAALSAGKMDVIDTGNEHAFGFVRVHGSERVAVLANFSEHPQTIPTHPLRIQGFGQALIDLISEAWIQGTEITLGPYQLMMIAKASEQARKSR
jgi:amylosucrase